MLTALEPRWKGWILIAASLIWLMSSPCTSLPQAHPVGPAFKVKMQTGCGVVLVLNGENQKYYWLCDNYGPISFYPDAAYGFYKFTVLTGFPSDAIPSKALPTKVSKYEISPETAFKVAHSVLIRSNDCVYFPEPIQDLFQFELGNCPPEAYQGEPVVNPYWKRKQYEDDHKDSGGSDFIGVTLPTELRPSQLIPDSNSAEIDSKLIADVGPSLDFAETTFSLADLGSWS